jgi:transcriptional regulator with XRE-family HTH domain
MVDDANQSGAGTAKHPDHYLAEWRDYRGYSQRELAALIDESNSKISRIENGETELRPRFAKKVAAFFNIPLAALFTVNPQGEGRKTAEMLDLWAQVDPEKQDDLLRVMRAFVTPDGNKQTS